MNYKQISLSLLNSIVQYFNYSLFSLSALLLSKEFVLGATEKHKLLNFFVILILTVTARPVGSIIFGSIGDFFGRRIVIILSGLISSIGTISIYFIPSYDEIGIISTLLLIFSRFLFIAGLSGEIDGIRIYISEIMPKTKQNLGNGIVTFFTQLGPLIASFLINMSDNYNWKLFFLIGGILGLFFTYVRIYLPETSEFKKREENPSEYLKITYTQIILGQFFLIFRLIFIFGSIGSLYQFFIIFLPSYLYLEGLDLIKESVPYLIFLYGSGGLFFGYLADKIGSRKTILASIIVIILETIIFTILIIYNKQVLAKNLLFLICFTNSSLSVAAQIYVKNKINTAIRFRIFSLSHSIGSLIISSPLPYFCSNIAINYGSPYISLYPISALILSLLAVNSLFKEFK